MLYYRGGKYNDFLNYKLEFHVWLMCTRIYVSLHEIHVLIDTKTETSTPSWHPTDASSSIPKAAGQKAAS